MQDIIFLNPVLKHTIWGGTNLRTEYGYQEPGDDLGECWGISAHPSGDCIVKNGELQGKKLSEVWLEYPGLFGKSQEETRENVFPLLVKIIDAKADLSIQVHPDDTYADVHENHSLGKTECWYILHCKENAELVIGHNARTKEELRSMILEQKWNQFIRKVPVKQGDFIQIDPGCVHAIKGGITLLETQQSSDITYRVYDYDRLSQGKPRELHITQSLDVITVPAKDVSGSVIHTGEGILNQLHQLYQCKYYTVEKLVVIGKGQTVEVCKNSPYYLGTVVEGKGEINGYPVQKGDHFILTKLVSDISCKGEMDLIFSHETDTMDL